MKPVNGSVISSGPLLSEWDEDVCLCQDAVPERKRIDVEQRIYDEKRQKHRWKVMVRYHQDCPIHGCHRKETA